jgi:AcrR family transcriptional regulator
MHAHTHSDKPRRTQQERRDATRGVLLDATIAALCELGYHGTTTLEVERRAGVSRGARVHHFPTKASLLASAVDHLYDQLSDRYDEAFGGARGGKSDAERFRSGLRLLWSVYERPDYGAVLELQMASRTDDELRRQLREVGERHRKLAIDAAASYFPTLDLKRALGLIEAVHTCMVGLLMQRHLSHGAELSKLVLPLLDELVAMHLDGASRSGSSKGSTANTRSARDGQVR